MRASRRYARHANRLETVVYRRFTDRTSVALSELAVQCTDNADGESLRVAAGRLKRAPARQRVLFVVTDGKPYLSDGNVGLLDDDLRATLEECRRDKIDVFAFGFVDGPEAFYGDRYCRITTYEDLVRFLDTRVG
jgi:nitric oxide reductase activation protein